jgi:hypothetical protein
MLEGQASIGASKLPIGVKILLTGVAACECLKCDGELV